MWVKDPGGCWVLGVGCCYRRTETDDAGGDKAASNLYDTGEGGVSM
jgi:hypothetical protein